MHGLRSLYAIRRGFTLIELMVVLGIVVLISLLILLSTSRFNSSILLRSLAYEVGLSIREAQLYGVAVRGSSRTAQCTTFATGESGYFCASFGVHFDASTPKQYGIFPDLNHDGVYDAGETVTDPFSAQYGFAISNFCGITSSVAHCAAMPCPAPYAGGNCQLLNAPSSLDITFTRPSPSATIRANGDPTISYDGAVIVVSAPGGATRSVSVSSTGQIVIMGTGN